MSLETALRLADSATLVMADLDHALARVGLSFRDFRRLQAVGSSGEGVSLARLGAVMAESASQVVRETRPLEKLGWLERSPDRGYALTESGRTLLHTASDIAEHAAERLLIARGADEAAVRAALAPFQTSGDGSVRPLRKA